MNTKIRNIAVVAHVDHGKTTLVDALLKQSGAFRANQEVDERAMDSNELEKQRGITILSKCTSITWKDHTINIVDTPGHVDFGSEVERVLLIVDAVLLIVDAVEGVMPQTMFVLRKAIENNLKVILVVNKIDRTGATPEETANEVLLTMCTMNPDLMDSPILYGSGRIGYMAKSVEEAEKTKTIFPLLDLILDYVPAPTDSGDGNLSMLVSMCSMDPYFGRLLIGKVVSGTLKTGTNITSVDQDGKVIETFRLNKLFKFAGIDQVVCDSAGPGNIVAVAGAKQEGTTVNATLCDTVLKPIKAPAIEPSTLSVCISSNNSPLFGKEGKFLTALQIKERLFKEAAVNVGIKIFDHGDSVEVFGRGELQIEVLAENMRREGFEFTITAPKIVFKNEGGVQKEPMEEVTIDVGSEYMGVVMNKMGARGGFTVDMKEKADGTQRLIFNIPSRMLLGYGSEFTSDTKGSGVLSKQVIGYEVYKPGTKIDRPGRIVSMENGEATTHALNALEDRGVFFISPGTLVYNGMIIGESNRKDDLFVNPVKTKQLTNVRSTGKEDLIKLVPPRKMTLSDMILYIGEKECLEVTPKSLRMRKTGK